MTRQIQNSTLKNLLIAGLVFFAITLVSVKLGIVNPNFDKDFLKVEIFGNIIAPSVSLETKIYYNTHIYKLGCRKILGHKIIALFVTSIYLIIITIKIIAANINLIIYLIAVYIFVRSLLTKFIEKHIIDSKNLNKNMLILLWQQREKIAYFFLKLILIMIPARILIRLTMLSIFNFDDNIICSILLVSLCLPYVYYVLNIVTKFINKSNIKPEDWQLFNDFVIKNVNIYNILRITLILLISKYFFYYYLAIVFIFSVLLFYFSKNGIPSPLSDGWFSNSDSSLLRYIRFFKASLLKCSYPTTPLKFYKKMASENPTCLKSTMWPPSMTYQMASHINFVGLFLSEGASNGYNEEVGMGNNPLLRNERIYAETMEYMKVKITEVAPNNFNTNSEEIKTVKGYNWLHKNVVDKNGDTDWWCPSDGEHLVSISKSPILSMVYHQKSIMENKHVHEYLDGNFSGAAEKITPDKLTLKPQVLFKNDKYIGSVGKLGDDTLVVNITQKDEVLKTSKFVATHYLYNPNLRYVNCELEPVERAIKYLEEKYGVYIPNKNKIMNIITLTEVAFQGDLLRVLRPCGPSYTDLNTMESSPENYYRTKKNDWFFEDNSYQIPKLISVNKIKSLINKKLEGPITEMTKEAGETELDKLYIDYFENNGKAGSSSSSRGQGAALEAGAPSSSTASSSSSTTTVFSKNLEFKSNISNDYFLRNYYSHTWGGDIILFRDRDESMWNFKADTFLEMNYSRERLLALIPRTELSRPSCFFAVCTAKLSMELLYLQYTSSYSPSPPQIYSIGKYNNFYTQTGLLENVKDVKFIFNILRKYDGYVLNSLIWR